MLGFFRKYQRYFFLVITVVIIISFSFFGTYKALIGNVYRDQIAFTAIDGEEIKRSELDQLVLFLGTDAEDKQLAGGQWGPNFLNDGVIKKNFLQTGLAELIALQYPGELGLDLQSRLEKEKRFTLYVHPQAQFLGVETIWNYMAPEMKENYDLLRQSSNPIDEKTFAARVQLFNSEKKLSGPLLKQILRQQQRQYAWLTPDPNLDRIDLSLFNYHTVEDWFGPHFTRLVGEFIINSAKIARQQGYEVTFEESLADLYNNAATDYKQNINNPYLGVANSTEYFNEQLQRMGLDQKKAAAIWRNVLLFRRLFQDMGNSVFVDMLPLKKFNEYSLATVEGNLYKLPKELKFGNLRDLQKFEIYLAAVGEHPTSDQSSLTLPVKFHTPDEVAKTIPELVQKRYLLDISQVDKKDMAAKITLKDTWNWEAEENNWSGLQKEFPALGVKPGESREARMAALDSLDDKTRSQVDAFARRQIVDANPAALDKALEDIEPKRMTIALSLKGGKAPFAGLENREEFMKLLDQAKLGSTDPALAKFSADHNTVYRIVVIDRSPALEILTFGEAQQQGIMDQLLERNKSFDISKELKAIRDDYVTAAGEEKAQTQLIDDISASLRFFAYMRKAQAALKIDGAGESTWLLSQGAEQDDNKLAVRRPLQDQWKLEKTPFTATRSQAKSQIDMNIAFALKPNEWTEVQTPANGDLFFFQLSKKGNNADIAALESQSNKVQSLLSAEAQRGLGGNLIKLMKDKRAISLDYMNQRVEMSPE